MCVVDVCVVGLCLVLVGVGFMFKCMRAGSNG